MNNEFPSSKIAWLAKLEREDWSFRFVLIDVIEKTELTEKTEFRRVNCQRMDSVDSVNSVQIHEVRELNKQNELPLALTAHWSDSVFVTDPERTSPAVAHSRTKRHVCCPGVTIPRELD